MLNFSLITWKESTCISIYLHFPVFFWIKLLFNSCRQLQHSKISAKVLKVRSPREGEGSEGAPQATGTSSVYWEPALLTIVGHISVPFLQHQVDPASSSPDLFHSLTVGHPRCTFSIDLHQLVRHLEEETFHNIRGTKGSEQHCTARCEVGGLSPGLAAPFVERWLRSGHRY